jgi:hypothetical protein
MGIILNEFKSRNEIKVLNELKRFNQLLESTMGNVKPLISEQKDPLSAGYTQVNKIDLPNGKYIGNPTGYEQLAQSEELYSVTDYFIYDTNKQFTGYLLQVASPSRSGYRDSEFTLDDKTKNGQNPFFKSMFYKNVNYKPQTQPENNEQKPKNTLTNKVSTEGLKNITPEMISSPQFKGDYSGYVFGGVFRDIDYRWDCNGVEGMSGIRGMIDGEIISESVENMFKSIGKPMTDGKPGTPSVGFYSSQSKFIIYTTTEGGTKCINF